jgi:hypothetical protein
MKQRLELYTSATSAALASLDAPNNHALETAALACYQAAKLPAEDYDVWRDYFTEQRNRMLLLRTQKTPSQLAAEAAAKVAAAAVPAK